MGVAPLLGLWVPPAPGISSVSKRTISTMALRHRSKKNTRRMPEEVYETVMWGRAKGECEGSISPQCTRRGSHWHHRQRRNVGPDTVSNGTALCEPCHTYAHGHPSEAREKGLIVSSYAPDPAAVPVMWRGRWWLLQEDGTRVEVQGEQG